MSITGQTAASSQSNPAPPIPVDTAFGCPREFLDNRFVYAVLSPRALGLSVGVNMNPDKRCNFQCLYCEVNRNEPSRESRLDVPVMIAELERTLELVGSGRLRERPCYRSA
jgi:sulfatase maturation enzyme AslB (radical SAM superfamily)